MKIALTGATGFIGKRLVEELDKRGCQLNLLGREEPRGGHAGKFFLWDSLSADPPVTALEGTDAVIHLAGEPVAQRWNAEVKRRIRDSRVTGTSAIVEAMRQTGTRTLIAGSAIGYYGHRSDELLTERAKPGTGFLPEVCVEWESAARQAEQFGARVAMLRTGIVLGKGGGALAKMIPPFKMGVGGVLGSGRQWMSWIQLDDIVGLLLHGLDNPGVAGPYNGVAPNPVTNADFTKQLAKALHRPAVFPVPGFALKLLYGEMASVILGSQRCAPNVAEHTGYKFRHPHLAGALEASL